MYNVSRLWWIPYLIGIVAGIIATLLWNLLIGIIVAVVVFLIVSFMGKSDEDVHEDILKQKAEAGDQDAQREPDELKAKKADGNKDLLTRAEGGDPEAQYKYAIKNRHSGERFWEFMHKSADQGYKPAVKFMDEVRQANVDSAAKEARLAALPKCPRCGGPIEQKYVNQFWGSRYFHATYAPDCNWKDGEYPSDPPYRPR